MRILLTVVLMCGTFLSLFSSENRAIFVVLKSTNNQTRYCVELMQKKLQKSGFNTQVLSSKVALVNAFNDCKKQLSADDKLLVFVLGYAAVTSKNVYLATTQGKMTGWEFKGLLDGIKARKSLFLLNYNCGGLYRIFAKKAGGYDSKFTADYSVKSRTTPLFAQFWAEKFPDDATDSQKIHQSILKTQAALKQYYRLKSQVQLEKSSYTYVKMAKNSVPHSVIPPTLEPVRHKATPAMTKLVDKVRKIAPKYANDKAFYFLRKLDYRVEKSEDVNIVIREIVQPNSDYAVSMLGTILPAKTGIVKATMVYDNGDYVEYDCRNKFIENIPLVKGMILILDYNITVKESKKLPFFQRDIVLQKGFPTAKLQLNLNSKISLKRYFYNVDVADSNANSWSLKDIPPFYNAPNMAYRRENIMRLTLTSLTRWDDFFEWTNRMHRDTLVLDEASKKFVENLTANKENEYQKVKAIYDYLNSMRYLTIPIGAGAIRPQSIRDIICNNYADCKDKATLLTSMCRAIGVNAYRVITKRFGRVNVNNPAWQFNHMICWIPKLMNYPDGLFLDPTDGCTPMGELPPGDVGSYGMVLDGEKYRFIRVDLAEKSPVTILEQNIVFSANGDVEVDFKFRGLARYEYQQKMRNSSSFERELYYNNMFKDLLINFDLTEYEERQDGVRLWGHGGAIYSYIPLPFNLERTFMLKWITKDMQIFDGRRVRIVRKVEYPKSRFSGQVIEKKSEPMALKIVRDSSSETLEIQFNKKVINSKDYLIIKNILQEVSR